MVVKKKEFDNAILNKISNYIKRFKTVEENRLGIETYVLISELKTPLYNCPEKTACCNVGDFIFIIDEEVWIRDYTKEYKEQFSQASYSPEFVRLNTTIFKAIINGVVPNGKQ